MLPERILRRLFVTEDGCWEWLGYTNPKGYGQARYGGRVRLVHRAVYEACVAPIPAGLQLDHLCGSTGCANPAHLEPVSLAENVRRSGVGDRNRAKTHCPQGHSYSGANLYVHPSGSRYCRACLRAAQRKSRMKRAA